MFDESLIPVYDGTDFTITKEEVVVSASEVDWVVNKETKSILRYKDDQFHFYYNDDTFGRLLTGDCITCGWDSRIADLYSGLAWGDILVLGLGLGVLPEYIKVNKNPTSIDVIESDNEVITVVDWLSSDINVINANEFTYTPVKTYDIIICELWAENTDITQDHKDSLLANYSSHLKSGGAILIPINSEILS
jgi:phospholipid N-methyltransferase